jgi:2-C-methyl-D-erythritol 4-phosphate cytidylyltransferase
VLPASDAEREGGVVGGDTRSESVRRGLAAVPADATIICVHDAARPFASAHLYREVIAQVHRGADGAVPALAVTDTIKQVNALNVVVNTPDRSTLVAVQTPQAFNANVLRTAHASSPEGTDDATLVEQLGKQVVVVAGETMNRKLTTPEDLEWARAMTRTES